MQTGLWWGKLGEGNNLKDLVVDERIILKWIFKKWNGVWIGFILLRTGTGGGLL